MPSQIRPLCNNPSFVLRMVMMGDHQRRSREASLSPTRQHKRREWTQSVSPRKSRPQLKHSDILAISGDGLLMTRSRPSNRFSRPPTRTRAVSAADRERQENIDRENRILLRKILEQHHGIRRNSSIPPSTTRGSRKSAASTRPSTRTTATSRQINQERSKHKTDYENLLLLQKIQNVKPSRHIVASFQEMSLH